MAILASKRTLTLVIPSVLDADQPDMHTFLEFWPEQAKMEVHISRNLTNSMEKQIELLQKFKNSNRKIKTLHKKPLP